MIGISVGWIHEFTNACCSAAYLNIDMAELIWIILRQMGVFFSLVLILSFGFGLRFGRKPIVYERTDKLPLEYDRRG